MIKRLLWNFEINNENSLKIPEPCAEDEHTDRWESRFFWPDNEIILLNGLDDCFLSISSYEVKHRQDTYCLLSDVDYNIKIRRNQPLYKPITMKTRQAVAYGKKINLAEQEPDHHLPGASETDAQTLLAHIKQNGLRITVEKEALIYRFETAPKLKLELARLTIANKAWFSVNIESHSRRLMESITQQMFGERTSCDYVTFLKGL